MRMHRDPWQLKLGELRGGKPRDIQKMEESKESPYRRENNGWISKDSHMALADCEWWWLWWWVMDDGVEYNSSNI